MELKETLKNKKKELENEFDENRKKATFFMDKKKAIDGSLEFLVQKGSLIAAKIEAIKDMLKE